jgi:hypothetical protein
MPACVRMHADAGPEGPACRGSAGTKRASQPRRAAHSHSMPGIVAKSARVYGQVSGFAEKKHVCVCIRMSREKTERALLLHALCHASVLVLTTAPALSGILACSLRSSIAERDTHLCPSIYHAGGPQSCSKFLPALVHPFPCANCAATCTGHETHRPSNVRKRGRGLGRRGSLGSNDPSCCKWSLLPVSRLRLKGDLEEVENPVPPASLLPARVRSRTCVSEDA